MFDAQVAIRFGNLTNLLWQTVLGFVGVVASERGPKPSRSLVVDPDSWIALGNLYFPFG